MDDLTIIDGCKIYTDEYGDINVILEDGHKCRFYVRGLTDEEYIKNARAIRNKK